MLHHPETIFGMRVFIERPHPRYVLPDDVPPPTGMTRQEFAAWSLRVCGVCEPVIPDGQVIKCRDVLFQASDVLHMNERTYQRLKASVLGGERGAA